MPNDKARCPGNNCPSKRNCHRFTAPRDQDYVEAALYIRREAGASACDCYLPVKPVTTFREDA